MPVPGSRGVLDEAICAWACVIRAENAGVYVVGIEGCRVVACVVGRRVVRWARMTARSVGVGEVSMSELMEMLLEGRLVGWYVW